ncbi:MAG TPA: lamin tail domain-containing protein [Verrucomicrobiales bacterium]|nr:lamin tail domain-containing protein [Verrucomicrobiales bacterium]
MKHPSLLCGALASILTCTAAPAQLVINEFLANNVSGIRDEVNEHEDWIEIENTSGATVSLSGWYLTDDATRLRKWGFPAWTLGAGKRLVVFASNRDRRPVQAVAGQDNTGTAAQPRLATNFKLSSNAGRYLALTKEGAGGAVTVVSVFASYPKQVPDVSYGSAMATVPLVAADAPAKVLVPATGNGDTLGASWCGGAEPFADAAWTSGQQGAGVAGAATVTGAANLKLRLSADTAGSLTTDTSGAAHNGTNTGNTTSFMPSATDTAASPLLRRGAMQFVAAAAAASSSQVVIPAHADFISSTGTIMFWMKSGQTSTAAGGSEGAILWDQRTTSGDVLVLTAAANANPGRIYSQPSGGGWFYSTARVDDDLWHHVAFVYNQAAGGTDAFYVDGVASGSIVHGNAWTWPAGQSVELGRSHDAYWQKYNGLLDEVRCYNTALSAAQIAQIYNGADENVEAADVGLNLSASLPGNAGAFLRIPFTVANPAAFQSLRLSTRANDGFVAWLNGVQIASFNAPASPVWNSTATTTSLAGRSRVTSVAPSSLVAGTNILAVQAMNNSTTDANFLSLNTLDGVSLDPAGAYLQSPTPGASNSAVRTNIGPFITDVLYNGSLELPPRPAGGAGSPDITVSAKVTPSLRPLAAANPVQLAWRIMYNAETVINMTAGAGGTWTASIPTTGLTAGQMLRWRIIATDNTAVQGTSPAYLSPTNSDQYYGTVAADGVVTQLPVYQVFVSGTYTANNTHPIDQDNVGGRASFFYDGELYDNVFIRIKGDTTRTLNKRAHRVDFNSEHQFRWAPGRNRMKELALNAEYVDPSYSRQMMSMWLHRVSGTGGPEHFPVRCQINGAFWQLAFHTETQDFELLENMGLDPNGAMYASVGQMAGAGGEKQTRVTEGSTDMSNFVSAISNANLTTRKNNVFDQIDIPATVNYLAVARITQEGDDVWANMVIHRDSDGTGEWRIIPFDTNLSWGQLYWADYTAGNSVIHATSDRNKSHPLYGNVSCYTLDYAGLRYNRFYDAIISVPETRAMLLRRMRSIMDQYLQPPGTANPLLEAMIDAHVAKITPEVTLDRAKWGWPSNGGPYGFGSQPFTTAVDQMKNLFIVPRRTHLFTTHTSTSNVGIANGNSAGIPSTPQPAGFPVTIANYDYNPAGAVNQDGEYIQLSNANAFAADISGWSLTGGVEFTFKGGTVINAGGSLYVSPKQSAFRARTVSPKGGEGRFVVGPYKGQISSRGETLELRDAAGTLVTSVNTPVNPTAAQQALRITELNYHPADPTPAELTDISSLQADDFEYIELINTGASTLNLAGARFTKGVDYTFPAGTTLAANARLLVVANIPAFQRRYGNLSGVTGPFIGALDNGGEDIEIVDPSGEVILDFSYKDSWYPPADGSGRSLVVRDAAGPYTGYDQPTFWAISGSENGSPGQPDTDFANDFTGWRWDHFTKAEITLPDGSENTALAGASADPDNDGLSNAGEYAFGGDPRVPDAAGELRLGSVTIGPDTFTTVTFSRRHKALDLTYEAQFSADLVTWTSSTQLTGSVTNPVNGMEEATFRDTAPAGAGHRFVRIKASLP